MKLYVWDNVLCSYTCGTMFAIANSADEARERIVHGYNTLDKRDQELEEYRAWRKDHDSVSEHVVAPWWRELQFAPDEYDEPIGFMCFGGG